MTGSIIYPKSRLVSRQIAKLKQALGYWMALGDFLEPWSGFGVRHIPEGSPYGILDFRFSSRAKNNRWNVEGQPTLYLASEKPNKTRWIGLNL